MLTLTLTAVDEALAQAWHSAFDKLENISIHRGSIFDLEVDAVVSPANSFGFMDGGIDRLYTYRYGPKVQETLQSLIKTKHHGELLVGTAEIVPIPGQLHSKYLIAAPTMRVPRILTHTVNPYLAARAVFLLIKHGRFASGEDHDQAVSDKVQSIAFPGLGTGVGRVPANICARQVKAAYQEVILGQDCFPKTWFQASAKHQKLYTDSVTDLQYEAGE